MARKQWLRHALIAGAMCLIAGSCSDSSPAATDPAQPTTVDSTSTSDAANSDVPVVQSDRLNNVDFDSDDPHCDSDNRCPRQLTPNSWTGYHGSAEFVASLGAGRVLSHSGQGFQLWDTTDFAWGRYVEIDEADLDIDINAVWHLEGTRFVARQTADPSKPSLVVMDVAADNPASTMTYTGPVGGERDQPYAVGQDRILTDLNSSFAGPFAVWPIEGGDPLFELDVDAFTDQDSTPYISATSDDGDIYIVSQSGNLYRWDPPAEPRLIADLLVPAPGQLVVAPSGRVLLTRHNETTMWDPETNAVTELTGVAPGEDVNRLRGLTIGELPDGRITVAYSDGRVAFWDPAQPDSPTIAVYDDIRSLHRATVMPDGRLLLFFTTSPRVLAETDVDVPILTEFQLITPPAPN